VVGEPVTVAPSHDRQPRPCLHAYTGFRSGILVGLTRHPASGAQNGLLFTARAGFFILDLPTRWLMDFIDTISGTRGYFAAGSLLAAYLAIFGLIDAKSTQDETHSSLERSLFITLVSSQSSPSFIEAMKDFGLTQNMVAVEHPSWFKFWEWGQTYYPNKQPLWRWAEWRLRLCSKEIRDCALSEGTRLDLNDADLSSADLHDADLHGANIRWANLRFANLSDIYLNDAYLNGSDLHGADLQGAHLSGSDLSGTDLRGADLRGADLVGADLSNADLRAAVYSRETMFPIGFDPFTRGLKHL